jgi:Polyketide cyclase / dehydrase and lipid transport
MRDNSTCDSCARIYLAGPIPRPMAVPTVPPSLATQPTKRGQALTTATTGQARVEIDAAPLTVYQLISDITRMGDWSPECYRCEWLNGATTAAIGGVSATAPGP